VATFIQFMRRHMRNEKQRVVKIARSRLDSRDAQGLECEFDEESRSGLR
jgi:hypothetical protein